jgi:hypothetical protein
MTPQEVQYHVRQYLAVNLNSRLSVVRTIGTV